jgi:predicted membrane-bound mannosyltransferase
MKIFGYEPAAWAGLLQGVLGALVVFNVLGLNDTNSVLVQAAAGAAFALVTAFYTKKVNLAVVVGALQSLAAVLVGFGVNVGTDAQSAAVIAAIQIALAGFLRQNTEPAADPGFNSEPLVSEPVELDSH